MIFRSFNSAAPPIQNDAPAQNGSFRKADFPEARLPESAKKKEGQWSLDDVATQRNANQSSQNNKAQESVRNGDWSMDDGPTKRSPGQAVKNTDPNSSVKKGDWSFDEVTAQEDGKSSGSAGQGVTFEPAKKSKPSKTKKGDWSFEEIDN